jgi:hypothetical protein
MEKIWKQNIDQFLKEASREGVKMLLVGGGAVNFYGYQRNSADVDFWIDTSEENFSKLLRVFKWNVLNLRDLIESKRRAGRPKALLDILELKSIHRIK